MKKLRIFNHIFFVIPVLILLSMSLILMYHSSYISNIYAHHFIKQAIWISLGIVIFLGCQFIRPDFLFKASKWLYLFSVLCLILVLFFGESINGARAWLNFYFFRFQPSELMKLSYSLYLSHLVYKKRPTHFKAELKLLIHILFLFLIPTGLVFLEPDTGAILFYFLITIVLLWNSKIRKRWLVLLLFFLLIICGSLIYLYFYQRELFISLLGTSIFYRIERLLTIGEGMQIEHALIAIGSAPLFQLSLNQVGIYIPESPTDFIFALCANVFGIMGNAIVLMSYFILDVYLLNYTIKIKKKEYQLFSKSFLIIFIFSQIINIAMNLGIFPIIGIPLPLLSYGGSSMIIIFLYLGIIFARDTRRKKKEAIIETLII